MGAGLSREWYLRGIRSRRRRGRLSDEMMSFFKHHRCVYCGQTDLDVQCDHIEPLSRGGEHSYENTAAACRDCNISKGNLFLLEWVWRNEGLLRGRRYDGPRVAPDPKPRGDRSRKYVVREGEHPFRDHHLPAFGESKLITDWAKDRRCVVSYGTLKVRLAYGWTPERAIAELPANRRRAS